MFIPPSKYPFLKVIKDSLPIITHEFLAASEDDHVKRIMSFPELSIDHYADHWVKDNGFHSDQIGYDLRDGNYISLSIFKRGFPVTKTLNANSMFPRTLSLVSGIRGVEYAGFFIMMPGAHLGRHVHNRSHLIYHLLLNDLIDGDCEIICNGQSMYLRGAGDEALFDYSLPHETFNRAQCARVNFVLDFKP